MYNHDHSWRKGKSDQQGLRNCLRRRPASRHEGCDDNYTKNINPKDFKDGISNKKNLQSQGLQSILEVHMKGEFNASLLPTTTVSCFCCSGDVSNLCSRFDHQHQCCGRGGVQGIPVFVMYRILHEQANNACTADQRGVHARVSWVTSPNSGLVQGFVLQT